MMYEKDIIDMITRSSNFDMGDLDFIMAGFESAKKDLVTQMYAEQNKDLCVTTGAITEFIIVANLKDNTSEEPKYIMMEPVDSTVVIETGDIKSVNCVQDIDRFPGFRGVKVAMTVCSIKENMIDDGLNLNLITSEDVDKYIGPMGVMDLFEMPRLYTSVDDDTIAVQKKVYRNFLNNLITDRDRVLYIGGDFGSAPLRRYDYPIDCLYFDEEKMKQSKRSREINGTEGQDFYFSDLYENAWLDHVKKYTIVMHNYLYGDVYTALLKINQDNFTLVAMALSPNKDDVDIYCVSEEECSTIESYPMDEEKARKYKFQILYEADDYYIVYIDHGRYFDYKPYNYDVQIPFFELDTWKVNRYYRMFDHFSIYLRGTKSSCYNSQYYFVPPGKIESVQILGGTCKINGIDLCFQGLDGRYIGYINNDIIDVNMPGPYWVRRLCLFNHGVIFNTYQNTGYRILNTSDFLEVISDVEFIMHEYVIEKEIPPYIELRGVGYNPVEDILVVDKNVVSYMFVFDGQKENGKFIRISLQDDSIYLDPFGPFFLVTSISYSRELYAPFQDTGDLVDYDGLIYDYDKEEWGEISVN